MNTSHGAGGTTNIPSVHSRCTVKVSFHRSNSQVYPTNIAQGQFSTYFPAIISPNQGMQLHWAGDGTSIHHGWVIGGLNSAWRSVAEILSGEERYAELEEFYEKWGKIEEVELSYYGFEEGPHPGYENPDPNNE